MFSRHFHPVSSALSYLSHNQTHLISDVFSSLLSSLFCTLLTFTQPNSFTFRCLLALVCSLLIIVFTFTQPNSFTFICLLNTSIQSSPHPLNFHRTQIIHFQMCSQPFYLVASLSSSL